MRCDEFEQILEQERTEPYSDPAAEHLETCEPCRALAAELNAIRMGGHALGEQDAEEVDAPDRVWTALRLQLEKEGLIRTPARVSARASWWSVFERPLLAGAVLSLIVIAGGLAGYQRAIAPGMTAQVRPASTQPPTSGEQASLSSQANAEISAASPAVMDVSQELQSALSDVSFPEQDAVVAASLRRNLNLVDSSIAICEKSVREQPENEIAREYLYGAYQQKAELLDAAMDRSMTGGLQ